jgi:hypothetical protein
MIIVSYEKTSKTTPYQIEAAHALIYGNGNGNGDGHRVSARTPTDRSAHLKRPLKTCGRIQEWSGWNYSHSSCPYISRTWILMVRTISFFQTSEPPHPSQTPNSPEISPLISQTTNRPLPSPIAKTATTTRSSTTLNHPMTSFFGITFPSPTAPPTTSEQPGSKSRFPSPPSRSKNSTASPPHTTPVAKRIFIANSENQLNILP